MMNEASADLDDEQKLMLKLYVSGMSSKSMEAIENIKRICAERAAGSYELEIVDIYRNPEAASEQHIVFTPSLIKSAPLPKKILIGNLGDTEKVMRTLGISLK